MNDVGAFLTIDLLISFSRKPVSFSQANEHYPISLYFLCLDATLFH